MADPVVEYYNQNPSNEWSRLTGTPYRRLEFEVALHYLLKHLPASGRVADIGGGPGRYTIALAKHGHRMTLVDCSDGEIQLARQKIRGHGVASNVEQALAGDARDLSMLPDGLFDAVLLMGPLYHLQKENERRACLSECHRVLKSGGFLFATSISRWSFIRDAIRSHSFSALSNEHPGLFETVFQTGHSSDVNQPNMHFCDIEEHNASLKESGFVLLEQASLHGLASFMVEQVNELAKDSEMWNKLTQWAIRSSADPKAIAAAEYIFSVAQKTGS